MKNKKRIEISALYPPHEKPGPNSTENRYYTIAYNDDGIGQLPRNYVSLDEAITSARESGLSVYLRISDIAGGAYPIDTKK